MSASSPPAPDSAAPSAPPPDKAPSTPPPDTAPHSPRLDWLPASPASHSDTDLLPASYPRPNFYSAGSSSTVLSISPDPLPSPRQSRAFSLLRPASQVNLSDQHSDDLAKLEDFDGDSDFAEDNTHSSGFTLFSVRGCLNVGALVLLIAGLLILFAGYPIIDYFNSRSRITYNGLNIGGINSTGQYSDLVANAPSLIDATSPNEARTRTGFDGKSYSLVFSDEFNTDNRTFWPGDDPFWEAVDLHYSSTNDLQWYSPDAVTTKSGNLVITVSKQPTYGLDYQSGMLQSWNKFCFTGGYIEVSLSLPGTSNVPGFYPGVWTMGNLGRAGYGATTDGVWPYSYSSCDVGTLKNQTNGDGTMPAAALSSGQGTRGALSYQPGQRLSACTCKGDDHPGPSVSIGRGAPQIDVLQATISSSGIGEASQSALFAPYDDGYAWHTAPGATIHNTANTHINTYRGDVYQEAASAITSTDPNAYVGGGRVFQKFGFEYQPGLDGHITWSVGNSPTWTLDASAVDANSNVGIGPRIISQEPMSIVLSLALSSSFQTVDLDHLQFPSQLLVDYVRVYQKDGEENVGCDPIQFPTANYIANHRDAYTNANWTTWSQAGYQNPRNSLQNEC